MLDPRAFLINSKTGRVVAATFVEFLSGNSTNPSISFTDSPDSGLQCDNAGAVNYVKNGINLGELGTASNLIGGSDTQIQFNDSGSFAGSADLTWDDTGKELGVGGDINLTGSISVPLGSNTSPSVYFGTDVNSGLYSPGPDQVAISTNGAGRLFVDASGNVGLGTSSPSNTLHVIGTGRFNVSGANNAVIASDSGDPFLYTEQAAGLKFGTNSAVRMTINSSGNVGIGTTSPGSALEIDAAAATSPFIAKINTSEAARIDSSGRLLVGTSGAYQIGSTNSAIQVRGTGPDNAGLSISRFSDNDVSGYLSIGKARGSIATPVIVNDDDTIGTIQFAAYDGGDLTTAAAQITAEVDGTPGANDMPGRLVFSVTADGSASPTEAMRINNAGELLVGYTSDNGAYKLQVNSQIFATSATIATSDGRYKENVAPLNGSLDLVKALRPVSFTWKQQENITRLDDEGNEVLVREGHNFPEGTQVGFIAQEVQEVFDGKSWLGSVIKENVRPAVKDNDGNELAPEEQFYGIAEGNLIAVLTNALQEAVGRIETLEAEVAALKS